MACKELDDRELLNRYANIWIPRAKKKQKNMNGTESTTEQILELIKNNKKEYAELIAELRQRNKRENIQADITEAIMNVALIRSSGKDWDDIQRAEKKLDKLWEELWACGGKDD